MKRQLLLFLLVCLGVSAFAQVTLTDASINAGESLTLTKDNVYLLDGYVYVEAGATLTIEPGTVIKGKTVPSNTTDIASALIIARGGKIIAEGTEAEPIIFTGEIDDLSVTTDLTATDNQTWGGLIILGNSIVGEDGGTDVIEGIPSTEPRIAYGGNDPMDDSGILKYVSIRHGGSVLGADNEINGLTLGGVGAGTTIDYIEVFANKDDGIELFGGTVNITHAVVGFVGDDSYDMDESWNGYIQFALAVQGEANALGDNAIEYDGSEEANKMPNETGRIYNGTFIGPGADAANAKGNGLFLKSEGKVQVWNSIFVDQKGPVYNYDNAGESAVAGNIAFGFAGDLLQGTQPAIFDVAEIDPQLGGVSRSADGGLDPRPNAGSPALGGAAEGFGDAITTTSYRGAFSNSTNWAMGWTAMAQYGYFGDLAEQPSGIITDASIEAGQTLTLTSDVEWTLDGFVYVEEGATLVIEAGTVVKANAVPTTGDLTSALIIAKGGRIIADGRADAPIIFTSSLDDLSTTTDLTALDNQTWGGIIILGNSIVGEDGGTDVIEGIPSNEPRIAYGGDDPMDDSGILRYVSIRHGGSVLGADNEINGLTLGGVGNGTVIDYIEVFANKDDGIELFGGTVNITHAVVGFVGDDSYDMDESWNGYIQFALAVQGEANGLGDNAIEYDGSEEANKMPNETGRIYNGTFIGPGVNSANAKGNGLFLKSEGKVQVWNSLFIDQKGPVYNYDNAAESAVAGNYVSGNAGVLVQGDQPAIFDVTEGDLPLRGISRTPDNGLNPLPLEDNAILSGAADAPEEAADASFIGAFQFENWAFGWTAMSQYGYFSEMNVGVVEFGETADGLVLNVPAPNPVNDATANLSFELPEQSNVLLTVYDMTGRVMDRVNLGELNAGLNHHQLNVTNYNNGTFVMLLNTETSAVSQKFTVSK
ncbi:MAG: T9SS type A sorting domain-containing protein [Bacteroidota bacterium]